MRRAAVTVAVTVAVAVTAAVTVTVAATVPAHADVAPPGLHYPEVTARPASVAPGAALRAVELNVVVDDSRAWRLTIQNVRLLEQDEVHYRVVRLEVGRQRARTVTLGRGTHRVRVVLSGAPAQLAAPGRYELIVDVLLTQGSYRGSQAVELSFARRAP